MRFGTGISIGSPFLGRVFCRLRSCFRGAIRGEVSDVADGLYSARIKLSRANLHTEALERELRRFFKQQPKPAFRGQFEDDATRCVFYVERGYEQPPGDPFSLILGDAIHNFRCATLKGYT